MAESKQSYFVLRTKLMPPRVGTELLERPRLTDRLTQNLNAPVTMVAADAGSGKTTLIAEFLRNTARPAVWYQLDHTDADPVVFLHYIAEGIRNIEPSFGDALFPYLSEANEELLRFPERAADLLTNEILRSVERPFILVLDDYHHIGPKTPVHKIVDRMLQYSSEHLHLVITTRDLPPLAIMRRRSQSAALVITREDLLFTDDEVRELFRMTLGAELSDAQVAEYRKRTHGWITALQLIRQLADRESLSKTAVPLDLTDLLQRSEKDIFDYFAEEVLIREEEETQDLLMHLSLIESLPLDQCSLLFPHMRCSALLPALAQKNIFLTAAGDSKSAEQYRFHPLFRDFLLRRLRSELGQAGVTAERDRIAGVLLSTQQWEQALPFLLDAQNFDRAAEVIAERGAEWIRTGAIISLRSLIDRVPDEYLEKHSWSLFHKAEIARLQGNAETASDLLHRAIALFSSQKDAAGEAEALHSLASLARRKGHTKDAISLLEKAETLIKSNTETYLKCLNTRGLCLILEGRWNEAEQQFRVGLELAEEMGNDQYIRLIAHNLALAPGFRGDFGEAIRWFNRIFRSERPDKHLPQEAIGHLNVARLHLYRGELEKTEHHLERALELSQLFNLVSLLPEVLETYANYYREKDDHQHALEFYERAANAYTDAGIDPSTKELNEERAKFYTLRGDLAKARALLENVIDARQKQGNELAVNTARLCICRIELLEGKTEGLAEQIQNLLDFFRAHNHHYDEAMASMLLAAAYHSQGRRKESVSLVQRVLDLCARFDYEYWLKGEIRRHRAIFEQEDLLERLPPDLKQEVGTPIAPSPAISLADVAAPITDLTVNVLGPVEIFRDPAKPLAPDAWTTRRAREILCAIATSKNRRLAKDVIIDTFWKDEDPAVVEKNLHPTISHIRKALNSRQAIKQNFLIFRDGAYQLRPEFVYRIDAEIFKQSFADAQAAKKSGDNALLRSSLESAYALYRGEYMEGVYDDWAESQRQFYSEHILRTVKALAKLSVVEKQWNDALRYAREALGHDPYREDLHRLVMKILAAQRKPAAVKQHYADMEQVLKAELGVLPAAETRRLYQELMS